MAVEIKVPEVGESVTEVEIGQWLVEEGGFADVDDPLVEIESEKATLELPSPAAGTISQILKQTGEPAEVGEVIGYLEPGEAPAKKDASAKTDEPSAEEPEQAAAPAQPETAPSPPEESQAAEAGEDNWVMPSAQRVMEQKGVDRSQVEPTGPGGRILKEDAERAAAAQQQTQTAPSSQPQQAPAAPQSQQQQTAAQQTPPQPTPVQPAAPSAGPPNRETHRVRMTPIRRTIAARLVEAQQNAALLTTFNEVDMAPVKQTRADMQETFQERHGVKLGFMSFFVKAAVQALQAFPQVNAQIHGDEIIYHNYCDIGIAVGSGKGLVVPVLRNTEAMSFADIENTIADFGARAKENKISMDELQGGTFTISNGGVYGSMLSTPIVNPPQSGVLGMHNIIDRPVAVNGEVVIRPIMYIALTYDHRIVDGREAVTFLKTIKEHIEKPALLFDF